MPHLSLPRWLLSPLIYPVSRVEVGFGLVFKRIASKNPASTTSDVATYIVVLKAKAIDESPSIKIANRSTSPHLSRRERSAVTMPPKTPPTPRETTRIPYKPAPP